LVSTQDFLAALSKRTGLTVNSLIIRITNGGLPGVYVHPYVAINYGKWVSADFAVYTCHIVYQHLAGGKTEQAVVKNAEKRANQLLDSIEESRKTAMAWLDAQIDQTNVKARAIIARLNGSAPAPVSGDVFTDKVGSSAETKEAKPLFRNTDLPPRTSQDRAVNEQLKVQVSSMSSSNSM